MPERPRRPDLDEKFRLHPVTAEEALERLLGTEDEDDTEAPEDTDS